MKVHVWDYESRYQYPSPAERPAGVRRKTVAQILRAAYRKHGRDDCTRRAVKRFLH